MKHPPHREIARCAARIAYDQAANLFYKECGQPGDDMIDWLAGEFIRIYNNQPSHNLPVTQLGIEGVMIPTSFIRNCMVHIGKAFDDIEQRVERELREKKIREAKAKRAQARKKARRAKA